MRRRGEAAEGRQGPDASVLAAQPRAVPQEGPISAAPHRAGSSGVVIGIEYLRFVSAMAILIWHYHHFASSTDGSRTPKSGAPFYELLFPFYEFGYFGVQVFWCISGFIFFHTYLHRIRNGEVGARTFAANRFSRLYPLHFATLCLTAGLQLVFRDLHGYDYVYPYNDLKHFGLQLFFASAWGFEDGHSFNGPIWSVSAEIVSYALFYLLVSRLPLRGAFAAAVAAVAVFLLLDLRSIAQCVALFFVGGIFALLRDGPMALRLEGRQIELRLAHLAAVAVALTAVAAALLTAMPENRYLAALFKNGLMAVIVLCVVWAEPWFGRRSGTARFIGNLTYSSYLIHFPIQLALVIALPALGLAIDYRDPVLLLGYLALVLAAAAALYRWFEAPMQRRIRRRLR